MAAQTECCLHSINTASVNDSAAHRGGIRSNNRTSAYAWIEKGIFDLQKTKIRLFIQTKQNKTHIKIFVYCGVVQQLTKLVQPNV